MGTIAYFIAVIILIIFSVLGHWRANPVIFIITAGISMMVGLYSPDGLSSLGRSTIGVGIGLILILYSFLCLALAYGNMLIGAVKDE